jgi:hypothetical protein
MRVERIERQLLERGQQPEILGWDAKIERAAPPADRAIANPDVIEVGVDLILDAAAMA